MDPVLIIDNDPVALELMTRSLAKEGVEVLTATDGPTGLAKAREAYPLAIFLDVQMPGMDGWEVLSTLKGDPELASIPVVMITIIDEKSKGHSLGAADYLLKPPNRHRLAALIQGFRQARAAHEAKPDLPAAPSPGGSEKPVLVVEDNPTNREMLARVLRKQGWSVVEAENGQVALEMVAREEPELILLDLMLPVMDGLTFLQELRKNPAYGKIPVVVLTAKDLSDEDRATLGQTVQKVLQKGAYNRDELLRAITG